jgi:dTDP-4-amino-4,6-dideoxygalactose transaminase
MIPSMDLIPETRMMEDELMEAVQQVLRDGRFIMGPNVAAFEEEFAAYLGVQYAVAVNSGTDALVISLRSLGVGPGDEVITTPFTFFATAEAISSVGARPVFVDIDPDTLNIDASRVAEAVTGRTRAVVPVHLFGLPVEMDDLADVAGAHNLLIVEDCAQSLGATYKGQLTGSFGAAAAFSFFPSKTLGGFGDGGMLVTSSEETALVARALRTHGGLVKYHNEMLGYNSRLDELQAALLRVKFRHFSYLASGRARVAELYSQSFQNSEQIRGLNVPPYCQHAWHQYTVRLAKGSRDWVARRLIESDVQTMVYYPVPLHKLPVYEDEWRSARFVTAETAAAEVLSLPIWPSMSEEAVETVAASLKQALDQFDQASDDAKPNR